MGKTTKYTPLKSSGISRDFDNYIEYISFIKDISNDHWMRSSDFKERIMELGYNAKDIVAKELQMLNTANKADVAVIGDFSAGKSSFINSLISKDICPVDSAATTSSVTKFIYAYDEKIVDLDTDKILSKEQYKNLVRHPENSSAKKRYTIEYYYPFSYLSNVNLYDTPGFSNATGTGDTNFSMNYAKKADALLLVIDINQGAITDNLVKIINEIKSVNDKVSIYAILNKADKKAPSARAKIKDEILANHDFLKECYVYTCMPNEDTEELVEQAKVGVFNDLISIGKEKDKLMKKELERSKKAFVKEFSEVLNQACGFLKNLSSQKIDIGIKNWDEIEKAYKKMAIFISSRLVEKRVQNYNKRQALGFFGDFLPKLANDIADNISDIYYSDLYFLIDEDMLWSQINELIVVMDEFVDNNGIAEKLIDEAGDDFYNNFFIPKLQYFHSEIIRGVNLEEPLKIPNIEDYDQKTYREVERDYRKIIRETIEENFEFFQDQITQAFDGFVNKYEQLSSKDREHYADTIDKIKSFKKFMLTNK